MTEPVTQSRASDAFRVYFAMKAGYSLQTLPVPDDPRGTLTEVPALRVAVLRYSGRWTDKNYEEHLAELGATFAAAGITTRGELILARYNAPYVLPFLRRNEAWLVLD